ncbi:MULTISPECIES: aldo/keto reductase [unclassified Chelatococcus]|uniref:aldo/keto reductase n=1 Tax=unclassified Chelatococcus TaxID=2638111 RepID=UPI001BCDE162|nr:MULTISPECIES: aldo/keto reductase [unclassified Chelatococcus]CAH1651603.1 2,5-didehydrogluconate reductase [Hyphomicrobiales bacterium]MBS7743147.1 aldo/keto reductase [Chelatococcus sp. HY11]MBX3541735.1 aldo/keto reductase [Chelatococcus sp.]MCO5074373.1 aldo/keto reductase [Chelatococcus sp.]CAH1693355.1 2,5-didehydrogluconate reductase [Hyphomicrobiales bacterium]
MQTILAHGARIPALRFGLFRMSDAEVERAIPAALAAGFRHFDTAQIYDNEAALGRALQGAGARREDIFLTTKVWVDNYRPERFAASVEESLEKLKVDRVDLLLLHWPGNTVPIADQIAMLNAVREAGKTDHIGVSNQNVAQLKEAITVSPAPIVANQIEVHPYLDQHAIAGVARAAGVAITAYFGMADGRVPQDPVLREIGARYGKTAAQVALRWLVQQGFIALSKTARPERVAENAAIFDFTLSVADMTAIGGLARPDGRLVSPDGLAPDWD